MRLIPPIPALYEGSGTKKKQTRKIKIKELELNAKNMNGVIVFGLVEPDMRCGHLPTTLCMY